VTTLAASPARRFGARTLLAWTFDRQQVLFGIATALVLVHLLDDSFVDPGRGVAAGHNLLGFAVPTGVAVAAAAAFPRLAAPLRVAVSFVFGLLTLFVAYVHALHIAWQAAGGSDYTGVVLFVAAGLFLLVAIALLLRPKDARSAVHRWARRAGVIPVALLLLLYVVLPVGVALWQTQKPRQPVDPGALAVPHEDVTLSTADGLELAGWYVPSKNRAAVLLVHGGGGSREGAAAHAEMLARHGYGVLLYDARGRGESEGRPDGYGWTWGKDVAAALAFLESRSDVARDRIGALGVSTGADVLIEAAAKRRDIHALVADGATARSVADARRVSGIDALPYWSAVYAAVRVFTGAAPGPPLAELVARVSPTPLLLISSDWDVEKKANLRYAESARPPVEHWQLPDGVGHTHGLRDLGPTYERRVTGFFDRALLSSEA
jgi:fermentation-respiration switch protein FrsA (DUF1100 family)